MADALITYGWCRTAYVALRSLNELGLKVSVADSDRVGMSQWSKYCTDRYRYVSHYVDENLFIDDILNILTDTGAHFLLPAHDETEVLSKYRDCLPSEVILPVDKHDNLELANDKYRSSKLAHELGVPVPRIIEWKTVSELKEMLNRVGSRLVIKLRRGNSAKGVFYPNDNLEAIDVLCNTIERFNIPENTLPIIQERVSGDGWGVSCLYHRGTRIASFTHKRLREKIETGGTSTLRISARNEQLESYAFKILDYLSWHGLAMIEFKHDEKQDRSWFIEINPRLWGSIGLAVASGVDLIKLLYTAHTKGPEAAITDVRSQKEGVVSRWWLGDAILAASKLKKMKFIESIKLLLPGWTDVYDDIRSDDLRAFIGEILYYFKKFLKFRDLNPYERGMLR